MLETWEAGVRFLQLSVEGYQTQTVDIPRLLGWIRQREGDSRGENRLNHTASAFNAAHALIFPPRPPWVEGFLPS